MVFLAIWIYSIENITFLGAFWFEKDMVRSLSSDQKAPESIDINEICVFISFNLKPQ